MKTLFQYTHISRAAKFPGGVVLNIQHRTHFIAILCLEATIVKIDIADHLRINKTQSFLLTAPHQIRTEDLEIIYINQVFVIASATNIVLRSQFVIRTNND